jgi:DnaK suppressor protein
MLDKKEKSYYKKLLSKKLEGLFEEADKTVNGMTALDDKFPDPTDRAAMESERSFTLRIRDRERKLITKIEGALERIGQDTYGVCDYCEEDISEGRLKARPVTTLCIECKKQQESEEKAKGL